MFDPLLWRPITRRIGLFESLMIGVVSAVAATGLRLLLTSALQDEAAFTPDFLALFLAAYLGGWLSGLVSMLLAGLITFYTFLGPTPTLVRPVSDVLSLLLFWLVAGLILLSIVWLRTVLSRLAAREQALLLAQTQERLLTREMGHRIKNLLAVVQGMVDQSLRASNNLDEARERILSRLGALDTAQELALSPMQNVRLAEVVQAAVRALGDERICLDLEADGQIAPQSARGLVLALHELATNALKYGALSQRDGRVWVTSRLVEGHEIGLRWKEAGGPPVEEPLRQGFGSKLIARALPGRGETTHLSYEPTGVECVFRLRTASPTTAHSVDNTRT